MTPLDLTDRFDEAAAWAALPETLRAAIGATLMSGLAGGELVEHGQEVGDERYARIGMAVGAKAAVLLGALLDEVALAGLDRPSGEPRIPALLGMVCERCGCSEQDACPGRCGWARDNLCTACAEAPHAG